MKDRVWTLLLGATLLAFAPAGSVAAAAAEAPPEPAVDPAAPDPEPVEEPLYAAPTTPDRIGRIMAPVFVNGRGPYLFVVDLGASRSAIAPRIVAKLGLAPDPVQRLILRGVTGTQEVPAIMIDRLQAGDVLIENVLLPVVAPRVFANADGILGVDGFERMCLHADFATNRIAITGDGCSRLRRGWIRIPATLRFGRLVNISAVLRGRRVQAIIDTGAERSLGNPALLHALSLQRRAEDPASDTQVFGATSHTAEGNLLVIPTIYLGEVGIRNMRVTFGDFEVFRLWDLEDEPAIVVGMDVLGTVDALMVDYARSELRILPRGSLDRSSIRQSYDATLLEP